MINTEMFNTATSESSDEGPKAQEKSSTIVIGGVSAALGAMCPKCGLETRLDLGSTPFCQTCRSAGETLQDGDCCSELNRSS
jgi:hypothetical protein